MKILLLTVSLLFASLFLNAQKVAPTSKVTAAYSKTELQKTDSEKIEYLNYYTTDGFRVITPKSSADFPLLSSVLKKDQQGLIVNESLTQDTFNPLLYNIIPDTDKNLFFKIDGTDKAIMIYSQSRIDEGFKRHKINASKLSKK